MKKIYTVILSFLALTSFGQKVFLAQDFSSGVDTVAPTGWTQNQLYTTAPAVDWWRFYPDGATRVGGNFSGKYAIFDSDSFSNNNAFENIALESPSFSTQGYQDLMLKYDVAIIAGGNLGGYIEISKDGGAWEIVRQFQNQTTAAQKDSIAMDRYILNSCNIKIRFRFQSNSLGRLMFDNLVIYTYNTTPRTKDIRVVEFFPKNGACGSTMSPIALRIRNDGVDNVNNVPLSVKIEVASTTQNYSQLVSSTLKACTDTVIVFDTTADLSSASNFVITAISSLSSDVKRPDSDTLNIFAFSVVQPSVQPKAKSKKFCGFQSTIPDTLNFNTGQEGVWYNSATSSTPIAYGEFFSLKNIDRDTSVWVETFTAVTGRFPQNNLNPGVGYSTVPPNPVFFPSGIFLDIIGKNDVIITDLEANLRSIAVDFGYEIYIKKGPYLADILNSSAWTKYYTDTIATTALTGGADKFPVGNISVKAGDTLGVYIFNTTRNTLQFSSGPLTGSNNDVAYNSNNVNPNTTFSAGLANFGYGGRIFYSKPCYSNRVKYAYDVSLKPNADLDTLAGFKGKFNGGKALNTPDFIYEGESFGYELKAPKGFTYADFGTEWEVTSFSMISLSGLSIPVGDTTLTPAAKNRPGKLIITPSAALVNDNLKIELKLTNIKKSCDSTIVYYIRIVALPKIKIDVKNKCANADVFFDNTLNMPANSLIHYWSFGNGKTSSLPAPRVVFDNPGTYTIVYEVTTLDGFFKDTTFNITVTETPVPNFKFIPECFGVPVPFSNTTSASNLNNLTYSWIFEPSKTSTAKDPSFAFSKAGLFDVKLISTLGACKDSITKSVRQFELPIPNFVTSGGCHTNPISFTNTSSVSSGDPVGAYWDFGDGQIKTGKSPTFKFDSPGTKNVKIIAESQFLCKDSIIKSVTLLETPIASFTYDQICNKTPTSFVNTTTKPQGVNVTYQWTFGDGNTSTATDPVYQYTFAGSVNIVLSVFGSNGCNSQEKRTLTIGNQPLADFDVTNGCEGELFNFVNLTTNNIPGTQFTWNFGDGNSSTDQSPQHTYNGSLGIISVTLEAKKDNCRTEKVKQVTVFAAPVCGYLAERSEADPKTFTFTANDKQQKTYNWSFAGTGTGNTEVVTHTFPEADKYYKVTLKITTDEGCECNNDSNRVYTGTGSTDLVAGNQGLAVYPNPSTGRFLLEINKLDLANDIHIYILDLQGRQVYTEKVKKFSDGKAEINADHLSAGTYLLRIANAGNFYSQKISVMK